MIFVSVGTDTHDFSRLLKAMDGIARKQKVIMQIGHSRYHPRHAEWFSFETNETIDSLYTKADIIVIHAGAGSIINALSCGKVPLVVPRRKAFGEHVNDHQVDVARFLARQGRVMLVEDVDQLKKSIGRRRKPMKRSSTLTRKLDAYLEETCATLS